VSYKRERSNLQVLELVLTLLAVIAGSVAATGSFLGASYERDRVELDRRPAVLLACEPEFRALDNAEGTKPPTNTVLLTARGRAGYMSSTMVASPSRNHSPDVP
jgi:hypothetical protein